MNLLREINAYVEAKLPALGKISLDVFSRDLENEVMARNDPSPAAETRYLDGSRVGAFNFSYYACSANSETARTMLEQIVPVLDFTELTGISDATRVKLESVTTPAFVSKSEAGEFIFVSSFRLEYHTGG